MPKDSREAPIPLVVPSLKALPTEKKGPGRPRGKTPPPPIDFQFEPVERHWYDWIVQSIQDEHPDLTNFDKCLLPLIGVEFIKYLRVATDEVKSKTVISQARQHPATNFARMVDMLSVSRKQRQKLPKTETEEESPLSALWKTSS